MISPGEFCAVTLPLPRSTMYVVPSDDHYLLAVVQDPTL